MENQSMDDLDLKTLEALYGEGVWEISKASQDEKRRRLNQAAAAGNAVSAVAGPAAVYSAIRHRAGGGVPRDVTSGIGGKLRQAKNPRLKKIGESAGRAVDYLNKPKSGRARLAAGVAGGTMIGLQVGNSAIDAVSAKLLNDAAKKPVKKSISKKTLDLLSIDDPAEIKTKAARKGVKETGKFLRKLPKEKVNKSVDVDLAIRGEVCKMNDEKKQVFGWASVIEIDGKPVIDLQSDVMTIETVEKAAYKYVHSSRKGGRQHAREGEEPLHVSDMIESFVLTPEKKEKMGIPESAPTGWWVGFQINDDDTWQDYKDGKLKDFSIHGSGRRVEVDA